ncbi:amidohydrolase family protein [Chelatococcus sp. GCM10030263]|uniref:amidohydrolase family protein n=1 Tax=Chelatococcus sp. GCM10030263 TaxID=3273387 RepID=UPI003609E335
MTDRVIDAHHHIWRQADLPWLQGPTVPRIFGPYDSIKRDYPIEEFLEDIDGTGVVASVYVQTNWAPGRAAEEVAWVEGEAERTGWPHAIVGFVDFLSDNAAAVIAAEAGCPRMRGVRQQLHWHENKLYRFAQRPDICDDPVFRHNLGRIAEHGWLFELQLFAGQMASGARLAGALPEIVFVLEHAGMLEDRSRAGHALWREGMKRLADQPNVHTKLSGLGTFLHRLDQQHLADVIGETIDIFGPERCLWGSNFPIEKMWTDYASLLDATRAAIPESHRAAVLAQNAVRLYRLPPEVLAPADGPTSKLEGR